MGTVEYCGMKLEMMFIIAMLIHALQISQILAIHQLLPVVAQKIIAMLDMRIP